MYGDVKNVCCQFFSRVNGASPIYNHAICFCFFFRSCRRWIWEPVYFTHRVHFGSQQVPKETLKNCVMQSKNLIQMNLSLQQRINTNLLCGLLELVVGTRLQLQFALSLFL